MSKTRSSLAGNIGKRATNVDKKPIGSFQDNAVQRNHIVNAAINEDKLSEDVKDIYFNTQLTLTAHAGGGQADATQLNKGLNIVSTCATRLDSTKLLASFVAGDRVRITNRGAKTCAVYPASGHDINGLADNAPVFVLPNNSIELVATVDNDKWVVVDGCQQSVDVTQTVTQSNLTQTTNLATLKTNDCGLTFRLDFNIGGTFTSSLVSCTLTFTDVVFKNIGSQSCSISVASNMGQAFTDSNTKNLLCVFGGNSGYIFVSGSVKLESHTLI